MYIIPWDTCPTKTKNNIIADIGDIRLILAQHPATWTLSMGIRVYSKDGPRSMVRPPATVLQIPQPCDIDEAKEQSQIYFNKFLSSVINSASPK